MPQKVITMLLTLLFDSVAFFGLGDPGLFHRLQFCLHILIINPVLIIVCDPEQEDFILWGELLKFTPDIDTLLHLAPMRILGTNVAVMWHMLSYLVRILLTHLRTSSWSPAKLSIGQTSILVDELLDLWQFEELCRSRACLPMWWFLLTDVWLPWIMHAS